MGWQSKLKKVLETAKDFAPIAAAFGVPGASTVSEVVERIHGDDERSNDDADAVNAAAIDQLTKRMKTLESEVEKLKKAKGK